jgi:hypothetical protein
MKTWEMIKALTENPKLKFKVEEFTASVDDTGLLDLEYNGDKANVDCNIRITDVGSIKADDWELIPQEVTWQEAIQAWVDGKTVYCKISAEDSPVNMGTRYIHYGDSNETRYPLSKIEFSNGKWYIDVN